MRSPADLRSVDPFKGFQWPEAMLRGLAENVVVGAYVLKGSKFCYVNDTLAAMLGYERERMLAGLGVFDVLAEDEQRCVQERIDQLLNNEISQVHDEHKARRLDGSYIDVEIYGVRMVLQDEVMISGTVLDITRRKKAEEAMKLTGLMYEHAGETMVLTDANGCIITVSPAFSETTGYSFDDVVGQRLNVFGSVRHDDKFYKRMWHTISRTGGWQGNVWNRHKSGEEYAKRLAISTSYNTDGSVRCRVGVFSDTARKRKPSERIWRGVGVDSLTGLPNDKQFLETLQAKMAQSIKAGSGLALLYLDLDYFKEVNDLLGHERGDELLKQVGERLCGCVRQSDFVARVGDDEFCLLLDGVATEEQTDRICTKITRRVAAPLCAWPRGWLRVGKYRSGVLSGRRLVVGGLDP